MRKNIKKGIFTNEKRCFFKLKSNSYTWIRIWIQQFKVMQIHAYLDTDSEPQPRFLSVLLTRDPVLFLGSGSGMKKNRSRIQDGHPGTYF
jgi:hypothetical protein